ncbi:MAG: Maf family nucleotide pyrophosphatase [Gammaproteobacteria bacterium]|nr:Maf family nucleotide pyrophosphatase [Gammaproteobacteria bacterium]MDH3985412.1 Maf family nucleotide pyrophosphatase [Gammaproteobacteria bacterium]
MNTSTSLPIVLASTSPYRKELLQRMGIDFKTVAPDVDESSLPGESPENLVKRLAEAKARVIGKTCEALIIGSDQVAVSGDEILGKPGSHENALVQLRKLSGKLVTFQTGLCLLNSTSNEMQVDTVPFRVQFRKLDEQQIERYLRADQPYNCAGSFKSEGLGITLFERMDGDDPTALIGLPLIRLTSMLMQAGVVLP